MMFIGLDIGTSAVKAVLVDDAEQVLLSGEAPLAMSRPQPGWHEQDADDWITALCLILESWRASRADLLAQVAGIGLSGQMHGAVCLGADDRPLRPVILWNDSRAAGEAAMLNSRHPELAWQLGVPAAAGFTAPKLVWMARHEPHHFSRLHKIVLPKDYIRLWLTGDYATDMSDAAGSWWLDEAGRDWSDQALSATCVSRAQLPHLTEGTAVSGLLRPAVAARLGLPASIPVAGGAGDAMAGAIGIGAVDSGAFVSLGTSGQFFAAGNSYRPLPGKFLHAYCHAVPGMWIQMAALLNGASCLAWAAQVFGQPIEALLREVAALPQTPGSVMFLPYLAGERTPHNDAKATGVFYGMTGATSRADLVRAVLEGVAYAFADAGTCFHEAGTTISEAALIGGGARSDIWAQIFADVLGVPITRFAGGETGPAFGAARLARVAAGAADIAALSRRPAIRDVMQPQRALTERHAGKIPEFRRLYQALKTAQ